MASRLHYSSRYSEMLGYFWNSRSHLPPSVECLKHEHLEPITLVPVTKSNGEVVYQLLEQAVKITGAPREIAGDHGPDLKSGIEKFCSKHRQTSYIHDIKQSMPLF